MIERMNNLIEDVREIRHSQSRVEQIALNIESMRRDMAHMDEKVRRLFVIADARGPEVIAIDKRVAGLERWNKFIAAVLLSATGAIGWGVQRIEYIYRMDRRIESLELILNSHNFERAMTPPVATGSK